MYHIDESKVKFYDRSIFSSMIEKLTGKPMNSFILFKSKEDHIQYYFDATLFDGCCEKGINSLKFGYMTTNDCLSAYCIHCNKKQAFGVKKKKNIAKRDNKHLYYLREQESKNRLFCELCLDSSSPLNVHHIQEVQHGGSNDQENLQLLCKPCHDVTHALRKAINRGK